MKKSISTVTALMLAIMCYSQMGVGTTTPNSTLDVRGSISLSFRSFTGATAATVADNTLAFTGTGATTLTLPDASTCAGRTYIVKNVSATLPVPVLTIATVSSQTIDGSASWLLDEQQETINLMSNGTNWNAVGAGPIKSRANYVLVKSVADLPPAVSGIITLVAGTTYEVNGTIVLTNKINLNGCYLVGMDANNDKLIYTPASGELFTGTKGGTIKTLTLVASTTGSKLFNLDMAVTENLIVRDNIIANCKDVGLVKGGYIVFFSVINYSGNISGITYQNNSTLLLDNTAWFPTNSGTFEKLVGTFDVIEKLGGFSQPMSASSGVALDITGITSITQTGNLKNTAFIGTGTKINGTFSNQWEAEAPGINSEKDSYATGNFYITTPAQTVIASANTNYKVLGTTTAATLFRVTSPTNNRLTYTGSKIRRFQVVVSLSAISSAVDLKNFSFYIAKNGVLLPESKQSTVMVNNINPASLSLSCTVSLAPNDYVELYVVNTSDATDITIQTLNLAIR